MTTETNHHDLDTVTTEGRMRAVEQIEQIIHAAAKKLSEPTPLNETHVDDVPGLTSTK